MRARQARMPLAHSIDAPGTTEGAIQTPNQLIFQHVSMAQLALQLGPPMTSRPVVDRTGVSGSFNFTLDLDRYLTDPETGKIVTGANGKIDLEGAVFRAVHEQLGLTMRPGRAAVEVLVVDHVEKKPVEN